MYPYEVIFGMNLYDICLTVAVVLVLFMADRMGIYRGFSTKLQSVLIFSIIGGVGLGFFGAIFFQAIYNAIETGVFVIDVNTGMTFYGGIIFGIIGFLLVWFVLGKYLCKSDEPIKKFGSVADIAACLIPLAHGIGRIGCLMAGCCHGAETDAWYGISMCYAIAGDGTFLFAKFVPVQLFEAIFLFALAGGMLWLFYKKFGKENTGRFPLLPVYTVTYGIWRFFIEFARADDRGATIVSFLSPSQLVAICMVVLGGAYFLLWYKYGRKTSGAEFVKEGNAVAAEEKIPSHNEQEGGQV